MPEMTAEELRYATVTCRRIAERFYPLDARDDYAQIGLEAILRKRPQMDDQKGWMGYVATWAITDELRRRNGRRDRKLKQQPLQWDDRFDVIAPEQDLDLHMTIVGMMDKLTTSQRQVAALLYQGYTRSEIARMLAISPAAITERVSGIRRRWQELAPAP